MRLARWMEIEAKRLKDVADACQTSVATISRVRAGKPPTPKLARRLVEISNGEVTFADLYGDARASA